MKEYRVTRDVSEKNWVKDQHVTLSDVDAEKWITNGALVLFPTPTP